MTDISLDKALGTTDVLENCKENVRGILFSECIFISEFIFL